ncbi:MAG: pyridoxal phosphate-dependent aminotransferase [Alistipes sp.]|jgi:cystathionine beta-lyase|nr:pyridoxal phosphate-dependent aminotransferase [Alistipes sp.]
MKKYNFDTILERSGTETLKYDTCREMFGTAEVIPMWIADMDFECAPAIHKAIVARATHNLYGYDMGGERCSASIRGWLSRRSGWTVEHDWLRCTTGVVAGLAFAIRAFTREGDGVVIQPPVYPPFRAVIEGNGRRVVTNPLRRTADGFEMDFDDLDRKLADARAIILCNPHNPVGRVFTAEELTRLGELCAKHDVTIISDEIHSDLVFAPFRHLHIASLDARFAERTITFTAPSKTFNIAGLTTSTAIIPSEEMRARWDAEYAKSHIPTGTAFGHIALRAAYDECEDWLEEVLEYLRGNVDYVRSFVTENIPAVKIVPQQGTYLVWMDFRGLGLASQDELMGWLVREAGLGLGNGADFGVEGIGFARLNAATNRMTVEKAMSNLARAVSKIG